MHLFENIPTWTTLEVKYKTNDYSNFFWLVEVMYRMLAEMFLYNTNMRIIIFNLNALTTVTAGHVGSCIDDENIGLGQKLYAALSDDFNTFKRFFLRQAFEMHLKLVKTSSNLPTQIS